MDVARRAPGELTVVGFAFLALGGLAVTEGARNGQDTITLMGGFAFAVLLIGIVVPIRTLRGLQIAVAGPTDVRVGTTVALEVTITKRARDRRSPGLLPGLSVPSSLATPRTRVGPSVTLRILEPDGEWVAATIPGRGVMQHRAEHRGVYQFLAVEARASGPLGVLARRKVVVVELANAVYVAPRAAAALRSLDVDFTGPEVGGGACSDGDSVRSVRPYTDGDPLRRVHWRSSARVGALMVRELESGSGTRVALVVSAPEMPTAGVPDIEVVAAAASALGDELLRNGTELVVCACERAGGTVTPVATSLQLDRLLAAAIPGTSPAVPDGFATLDAAVYAVAPENGSMDPMLPVDHGCAVPVTGPDLARDNP